MEPIGLVPILRAAVSEWRSQRKYRSELRRLLRTGRVEFPLKSNGTPWPFPVITISHRVALGIDELLFSPRNLSGMADLESQPSFWTPAGPADALEASRDYFEGGKPLPEFDRDYCLRHDGFARVDEYHRRAAEVTWESGWRPGFMEPFMALWAEAFERPWRGALSSSVPHIFPRGGYCTISRQSTACGVKVHSQGLGLRFDYHD